MQLIFETQPTEGIQINMSTQPQTSRNEDFSDIKKKKINTNTENNIDDGNIAKPERGLSNKSETDIDQVTTETVKESLLKEVKCLDNTNGNENKKYNKKENDLIANINSILTDNITNGTSNSMDENESKCENINAKIVSENILTINKNINSKINSKSNTDKDFKSVSEKDINTLTKAEHSKLELSFCNNTTVNLPSDVASEERSLIFTDDTDVKLKAESFSNGKDTIEVNKNESVNVTSGGTIVLDEGTNGDQILTNNTSTSCSKKELVNIFNDDQIVSDNNSLINEEKIIPSEVSANTAAMNNEIVTLPGETIVKNETLTTVSVKDPEHITINEETDQPSVEPADIAMNNKTDTVFIKQSDDDAPKLSELPEDFASHKVADTDSYKTNFENEELVRIVIKHPEHVVMDQEADKPSEVTANIDLNNKTITLTNITTSEKHMAPIDVTDSEAILIDDDDIKPDILTNQHVLENKKMPTSDEKNLEDIVMDKEIDKPEVCEDVAINNEINSLIADNQLGDATANKTITSTKTNEKQYGSLENTEEPIFSCLSLKALPAMAETHDVLMAEPTATPNNEDIIADNTERVCDKSFESSNAVKVSKDPDMSAPKTYEKIDDDTEAEQVPMEIDEIEIVDLDKENHIEKISKSKTSSNTVVSNEINNVEIIEPDVTSEKTINVSKTEIVTNEDVESNKTEASVETKNASVMPVNSEAQEFGKNDHEKVEILDEDDINIVENITDKIPTKIQDKDKSPVRKETKTLPVVCKLSNTLDILSDDEDEPSKLEATVTENSAVDKQCINIDDDDDIMLIEEDSNSKDATNEGKMEVLNDKEDQPQPNNKIDLETGENKTIRTDIMELSPKINEKDSSSLELDSIPTVKNVSEEDSEKSDKKKPLLPQSFLKTAKKNLADMTRDELEDFCILRIVESIVDRTNLSDIKTKIKTMAQNLEDFRKRTIMLTKQNRDLQVVLKSVQEEQKKHTIAPIQPLKITRSVGMQVLMNEKIDARRKGPIQCQPPTAPVGRPARALQKVIKAPGTPTPIPVPRKVPVNNSPAKSLITTPTNNTTKVTSPNPTPGLRNPSPVLKVPEKRTHSRMQASSSVTVDLTDDEPPPKVNNKNSPIPPVRVVPSQNLLPQQRPQFTQPLNSPRKVYIPISGPQSQAIRPGQTLMMKSVPLSGPRQRVPPMPRMQQSTIRIAKPPNRHPAPLPDAMKQYTPPTWKSLPPAPDLKLSKVENGIVISWKIDGYPDGVYETIASYQLYAYQETTAPPCTALWKKIGDVKALPLPMACTLTQFMAGFKYYFAVRAVDVRSRLGPFSLPGSILLLNKV